MLATYMPATRSGHSDSASVSQTSPAGNQPGWARCTEAYWPAHALDGFLLRMAAHGKCVSAAMMLGDRRYAAEQLECAWAFTGDAQLHALATELAPYFVGSSPFARNS